MNCSFMEAYDTLRFGFEKIWRISPLYAAKQRQGLFSMAELTTIKENNTFRRLYRSKKCFVYPQIVIYAAGNHLGEFRYGITASKKLGNAVTRCRCRRVIRAALSEYRSELSSCKKGIDIVIVARKKTAFVKSTQLIEPIGDCLRQLKIID